MECGDSSPPWTGQFIGPQSIISDVTALFCAKSSEGEMNFALEGGDESPHSKLDVGIGFQRIK